MITCEFEDRAAEQNILGLQVEVRNIPFVEKLEGAGCWCRDMNNYTARLNTVTLSSAHYAACSGEKKNNSIFTAPFRKTKLILLIQE